MTTVKRKPETRAPIVKVKRFGIWHGVFIEDTAGQVFGYREDADAWAKRLRRALRGFRKPVRKSRKAGK